MPVQFSQRAAETVAGAILTAMGCPQDEAEAGSKGLTDANLAGHDSHGIGVLYMYASAARAGELVPGAPFDCVRDGVILKVDGNAGLGQRVGREAMDRAIDVAREQGVCAVSTGNSFHLGRIGAWGEHCAAAGLVSIHLVGAISRSLVAPHLGAEPRLTTNPVCLGFPSIAGRPPLIADFATSAFAAGKVRLAYEAGEAAPVGALADEEGEPTTDAARLFEAPLGALLPLGGHKGYALSVLCEMLGGALAGNACHPDRQRPNRIINNMFSVVIDPERFMPGDALAEEADRTIAWLKSSRPRRGETEVLVPGEPEFRSRQARSREGFTLSDGSWDLLVRAARDCGIPDGELERLLTDHGGSIGS